MSCNLLRMSCVNVSDSNLDALCAPARSCFHQILAQTHPNPDELLCGPDELGLHPTCTHPCKVYSFWTAPGRCALTAFDGLIFFSDHANSKPCREGLRVAECSLHHMQARALTTEALEDAAESQDREAERGVRYHRHSSERSSTAAAQEHQRPQSSWVDSTAGHLSKVVFWSA